MWCWRSGSSRWEEQRRGTLGGESSPVALVVPPAEGEVRGQGEVPSEHEMAMFHQLVAKTSRRFAAGDVIMEAGACTRALLLLISGVVVACRPQAAAAGDKAGVLELCGETAREKEREMEKERGKETETETEMEER